MMAGVIVQWNSVTTLVGLCTFLVHTRLLGRTLTASQGFTSLSLFSILRFPLLVLPDVVNFYLQVSVRFVLLCCSTVVHSTARSIRFIIHAGRSASRFGVLVWL